MSKKKTSGAAQFYIPHNALLKDYALCIMNYAFLNASMSCGKALSMVSISLYTMSAPAL